MDIPITVPALLQQESMMLVFVTLRIGVTGIAFGRLKNKDSVQRAARKFKRL